MLALSPLGARGKHVKLASPKASERIALIPQRPTGPHRSAPPALQGPPGAARLKMRDDASRRISARVPLASRRPQAPPQRGKLLFSCESQELFFLFGLAQILRFTRNLRFLASSRDLGRPPRGASSGLLIALRGSQRNRANSRRAAQTLKKDSSP